LGLSSCQECATVIKVIGQFRKTFRVGSTFIFKLLLSFDRLDEKEEGATLVPWAYGQRMLGDSYK